MDCQRLLEHLDRTRAFARQVPYVTQVGEHVPMAKPVAQVAVRGCLRDSRLLIVDDALGPGCGRLRF